MSAQTNIEWTDCTWSPWLGCRRVSPGCKNCYIEHATPIRVKGIKHGGPRQRTSAAYWKQPLRWNRQMTKWPWVCEKCGTKIKDPEQLGAPFACPNCSYVLAPTKRPRVFPSLCDWLDDEVPIEWLADFLTLIHDTPNLDWLLLTKRPENFKNRLHEVNLAQPAVGYDEDLVNLVSRWIDGLPPANVWLGVSVEDQARADERIPQLLKLSAKVRFLSVEPLLESVLLFRHCTWCGCEISNHDCEAVDDDFKIDWVIVGGESGSKRRDCSVAAIVGVACQCQAADVPVFVKQDSALKPGQQGRIPKEIWQRKEFPKV